MSRDKLLLNYNQHVFSNGLAFGYGLMWLRLPRSVYQLTKNLRQEKPLNYPSPQKNKNKEINNKADLYTLITKD